YNECVRYMPFSLAGKAVLHVEYEGSLDSFCPKTTPIGFSSMKKRLELDAPRQVCPTNNRSADFENRRSGGPHGRDVSPS
ncbi:endo alpha-1,4 polygalactosaminidase, partial [Salmonella sp. SAL4450]|uniref:endo alpha-1,4 polygalactosaminidase n=1 Tax=Salmonella sp. SAL4450 TaxID=3159905 RepID=UPI00397AE3D9